MHRLILIFILSLSFILRYKNHTTIPLPGQSIDEYMYGWVGTSLYKLGVPVGLSGIPGYQERRILSYINVDRYQQNIPSNPLEINYPWMDHPPLMALVSLASTALKPVDSFQSLSLRTVRKPMLILGTLTTLLVFIYCNQAFGFSVAVIASLLHATTPIIILGNRMVQAENGLIPLFLSCLIFTRLFLTKQQKKYLYLAGVFAGLATLTKLSGLASYLFVLLSLFSYHQKLTKSFRKDLLFFLAVALPITLLFPLYGLYYGGDNFLAILTSNASRFYGIGPSSLFDLIKGQRLTQHKFLSEGVLLAGWLSFFKLLASKNRNVLLPVLFILSYFLLFVFFGSQPYGWYTFPFWPLLCILLAYALDRGLQKPKHQLGSVLLSILILGESVSKILNIDNFQKYSSFWRYTIPVIIMFFLYLKLTKQSKIIGNIMLILLLIISVAFNIFYSINLTPEAWWNTLS